MTSLFCSASTTASWTHFIAVSKSTISPLRTPRDGACPTPRSLIVPSGLPSPTTTQIFDVPISRPTIRSLLAITFFLSFLDWNCAFNCGGRRAVRLCCRRPRRFRRLHRDCFHDQRLLIRIDRVVDDLRGRPAEGDRNIALYEQVNCCQLLLGI